MLNVLERLATDSTGNAANMRRFGRNLTARNRATGTDTFIQKYIFFHASIFLWKEKDISFKINVISPPLHKKQKAEHMKYEFTAFSMT